MSLSSLRPPIRAAVSAAELADPRLGDSARTRAKQLYEESGTLLFKGVFPRAFVERLNAAFQARHVASGIDALDATSLKVGDRRRMVTIEVTEPFNDPLLYANPIVQPLLAELMEGDCVINGFGGVVAFPGALTQPLHRDHPFVFSPEVSIGLRPYAITMVVPLIDIDWSVGPTAVWEGSHKNPDSVGRFLFSGRPASYSLAEAGDVYLMDYRLVHAGMPNTSAAARPILYVIYSRHWFRDTVNYSKQDAIQISEAEYGRVPEPHRPLFTLARPHAPRR